MITQFLWNWTSDPEEPEPEPEPVVAMAAKAAPVRRVRDLKKLHYYDKHGKPKSMKEWPYRW